MGSDRQECVWHHITPVWKEWVVLAQHIPKSELSTSRSADPFAAIVGVVVVAESVSVSGKNGTHTMAKLLTHIEVRAGTLSFLVVQKNLRKAGRTYSNGFDR